MSKKKATENKCCGNCSRFEKGGTRAGYCGDVVVAMSSCCSRWKAREGGKTKKNG